MNPAVSFYLDLYRRCLDLRRTIIWSLMAVNFGFAITIFTSKDELIGKLSSHPIVATLYVLGFLAGWGAYLVIVKRLDERSRALLQFISGDLGINLDDVDRLYLDFTKRLKYLPIIISLVLTVLLLLPIQRNSASSDKAPCCCCQINKSQ